MRSIRNSLIYLVLLTALGAFLFSSFFRNRDNIAVVPLGQVAADINSGRAERITVRGDELLIKRIDGSEVRSRKESDASVLETLRNLGVSQEALKTVEIEFAMPSRWESWGPILTTFLPLVLVGVFFLFLLRQAQGAGNQALSFGRSRARMFTCLLYTSPSPRD